MNYIRIIPRLCARSAATKFGRRVRRAALRRWSPLVLHWIRSERRLGCICKRRPAFVHSLVSSRVQLHFSVTLREQTWLHNVIAPQRGRAARTARTRENQERAAADNARIRKSAESGQPLPPRIAYRRSIAVEHAPNLTLALQQRSTRVVARGVLRRATSESDPQPGPRVGAKKTLRLDAARRHFSTMSASPPVVRAQTPQLLRRFESPARRTGPDAVPSAWPQLASSHRALDLVWSKSRPRGLGDAPAPVQSINVPAAFQRAATAVALDQQQPKGSQVFAARSTERSAPTLDSAQLDRLADDVVRRVERRVRIERERRGL